MVVRAAAVLTVLAALAAYYAVSERLFDLPTWGDVAFLALVLIPLTFSLTWLALPLLRRADAVRLGGAVLGLALLTALLEAAGLDVAANFVKFAAVTAAGWWFLTFFEAVSWVLLVALLIVPVDVFSVFRGPTKVIVEEQPSLFDALSIAFPIPGEPNSAQLGLPDVLFFALFLGATRRFLLRAGPTWLLMALSFGGTLALAVAFDIGGLPALPLLSAAFVLANADLLWARRSRRRARRVAALYDVHGNLPALEAVLADVERVRADVIVVGGDVVSGPMPRETLERLLAARTGALFVRGNADREVASGEGGEEVAWAAAELTEEQRSFLASRPERVSLAIDGLGGTLFCHGSPRSDEEIVTAVSSDERVGPMLAGVEEDVVVCGHTHVQFERTVAGKRVVNAGSVGMPYEDEPGAYWALLGPGVELRRTTYDRERAAERIRATGFPGADEFAAENVLTLPSAAEATEHFERLAAGAGES